MSEIREVRTDSSGGLGTGMLVGILLVVVVLAVIAFAYFGGAFQRSGAPPQSNNPTNIQVNPPAAPPKTDVNVNVPPKVDVNVNVPPAPVPSKP